jgi:hypothetical protein
MHLLHVQLHTCLTGSTHSLHVQIVIGAVLDMSSFQVSPCRRIGSMQPPAWWRALIEM